MGVAVAKLEEAQQADQLLAVTRAILIYRLETTLNAVTQKRVKMAMPVYDKFGRQATAPVGASFNSYTHAARELCIEVKDVHKLVADGSLQLRSREAAKYMFKDMAREGGAFKGNLMEKLNFHPTEVHTSEAEVKDYDEDSTLTLGSLQSAEELNLNPTSLMGKSVDELRKMISDTTHDFPVDNMDLVQCQQVLCQRHAHNAV